MCTPVATVFLVARADLRPSLHFGLTPVGSIEDHYAPPTICDPSMLTRSSPFVQVDASQAFGLRYHSHQRFGASPPRPVAGKKHDIVTSVVFLVQASQDLLGADLDNQCRIAIQNCLYHLTVVDGCAELGHEAVGVLLCTQHHLTRRGTDDRNGSIAEWNLGQMLGKSVCRVRHQRSMKRTRHLDDYRRMPLLFQLLHSHSHLVGTAGEYSLVRCVQIGHPNTVANTANAPIHRIQWGTGGRHTSIGVRCFRNA